MTLVIDDSRSPEWSMGNASRSLRGRLPVRPDHYHSLLEIGRLMKNSTPVRIARDPARPSATDKTNVAVIAIRSMCLYQFIFSTNLAQTS